MPVNSIGASCGTGCGRPVRTDGYCSRCHRVASMFGVPEPIAPTPRRLLTTDALLHHLDDLREGDA